MEIALEVEEIITTEGVETTTEGVEGTMGDGLDPRVPEGMVVITTAVMDLMWTGSIVKL